MLNKKREKKYHSISYPFTGQIIHEYVHIYTLSKIDVGKDEHGIFIYPVE